MILKFGGILNRRGPERQQLKIGFVPTLDAAVLLVAQARGYFAEQGLQVQLLRQPSWQKASEKLRNRELDAAHMSGTEPLVMHLGMLGQPLPLRTAFVLAQGGSAMGVLPELGRTLEKALQSENKDPSALNLLRALAAYVAERRDAGEPKLRFAVTEAHSVGSYDLRYCLAGVGLDPEKDVQLVPITPTRMLQALRNGNYDGAWLDEPFGSQARSEGIVELLFSKHAFWNHSLGKVLAVHEALPRRYPTTYRALLRALLQASQWAEAHREDALELLSAKQALDLPASTLTTLVEGIPTLAGSAPNDLTLATGAANFPWYSQAVWYLSQMIRWGDYSHVLDFKKTAQAVFQPRYYREAARDLSLPHPSIGYKNEGEHAAPWELEEASQPIQMGTDLFFDGRIYKPRQTMRYLNGLDISHIAAPLDAMWAIR